MMNGLLYSLIRRVLLVLLLATGMMNTTAFAQTTTITVDVADGRNGRPLINQRVLLFEGSSEEDVASHAHNAVFYTDAHGSFVLTLEPSMLWVQVWIDKRTQCHKKPNYSFFEIGRVVKDGTLTPNDCGKPSIKAVPNHLVVFARPATLAEQMRW